MWRGWGFAIRDDKRVLKSGAGVGKIFLMSPFHAERLGVLAGLQAAANMGITCICVETDASLVKAALEGDGYCLSAMGGIITELKLLMSSEFILCKIIVCKRECNNLAHTLAALGCKFPSGFNTTWEGSSS